jgi:hypothetical protein
MINIRKFFRTYGNVIISISILLGITGGTIVGLIPAIRSIIVTRGAINQLSTDVDSLKNKANTLESMEEDTFRKYLSELVLAVPPDKSLPSLFSTIDGLGAKTGVSLSDFTLSKPGSLATASAKQITSEEKQTGSNLLPFTVTVGGTYDQIYEFVQQSIQVRRFFRVKYFDISFASINAMSVRMGMDSYYAPYPINLGSAGQAIESLSQDDEAIIAKITSFPSLGTDSQSGLQTTLSPSVNIHEDPFSP